MRKKEIEKMMNDMMLEVTARREADEKVYLRKVNEIEKRFENIENAVADALILIEENERKVKKTALKVVDNALEGLKKDIESLKEATKPTVSKMTTAADEQTAIFNEVIDEWLNGKKEGDE